MLNLFQKLPVVSRDPIGAHDLSDYYVALCQHLRSHFGGLHDVGHSIGVTSTACGEGVSTVSTNLAATAAQQLAGRVLLIDADVRLGKNAMNPAQRSMPGLFDILLGKAQISDCVRATDFNNVYVLGTGVFTTRGTVRYPKEPFKQMLKRRERIQPRGGQLAHRYRIDGLLFDLRSLGWIAIGGRSGTRTSSGDSTC